MELERRDREAKWYWSGLGCVAGMTLGLFVDLLRSPTLSILSMCSSRDSLSANLALHAVSMPAAHCGMVLGALLCSLWRRDIRPSNLISTLLWQMFRMMVAEIGAVLLFAQAFGPMATMTFMAAIMVVLAYVPVLWDRRRGNRREMPVAAAVRPRCGRDAYPVG